MLFTKLNLCFSLNCRDMGRPIIQGRVNCWSLIITTILLNGATMGIKAWNNELFRLSILTRCSFINREIETTNGVYERMLDIDDFCIYQLYCDLVKYWNLLLSYRPTVLYMHNRFTLLHQKSVGACQVCVDLNVMFRRYVIAVGVGSYQLSRLMCKVSIDISTESCVRCTAAMCRVWPDVLAVWLPSIVCVQ